MSTDEQERITVAILGRTVGTAAEWDSEPGEAVWFYDFEPNHHFDILPKGDLVFDLNKGTISVNDSGGDALFTADVVEFLWQKRTTHHEENDE